MRLAANLSLNALSIVSLFILAWFHPATAAQMSRDDAMSTARTLQLVALELHGLTAQPIPSGMSDKEKARTKKILRRIQSLAEKYKAAGDELEKSAAQDTKKRKVNTESREWTQLSNETELLSTEISQAVNEMNRMTNMFSKILQKLDEGQSVIIRNF